MPEPIWNLIANSLLIYRRQKQTLRARDDGFHRSQWGAIYYIFEIMEDSVVLNHFPDGFLGKFIKQFIYFKNSPVLHELEKSLPNGETEIIFNLLDENQSVHNNHNLEPLYHLKRMWVSGFRTRPITIPSGKNSELFITIFNCGMARACFQFPLKEIKNRIVDSDSVFDPDLILLREKLILAPKNRDLFQIAGEIFSEIFRKNSRIPDFISWATHLLNQKSNSEEFTISNILKDSGYSRKHTIDLFHNYLGVTPQVYVSISRFQKLMSKLEIDTPESWANLALNNGYYDQSHMIHDFKKFTGITPGQYLKKKPHPINYIPV